MVFAGDKKKGRSILGRVEIKLRDWMVPLVPKSVETYHLTYTTIVWSLLIILFGFLANIYSIHWLWAISLMIVLQYVTDLLDGQIGRVRKTGLIKWGYYMDHFLDYMFLCSILIAYSILLPDEFKYLLFFILAIFGGFMINAFLGFAVTNEFKISYLGIGPTEVRLIFILINTAIIIFGKTYMAPALPFILAFAVFGLCLTVYRTQKYIWKMDMKIKKGKNKK
jgi:phosphatidylglycerophosphate synthase